MKRTNGRHTAHKVPSCVALLSGRVRVLLRTSNFALSGGVLWQEQPLCQQAARLPTPVPHRPSAGTHPDVLQGGPGPCQPRYFISCRPPTEVNCSNTSIRKPRLPQCQHSFALLISGRCGAPWQHGPCQLLVWPCVFLSDPDFPEGGKVDLLFADGPDRISGRFWFCWDSKILHLCFDHLLLLVEFLSSSIFQSSGFPSFFFLFKWSAPYMCIKRA